MVDISRELESIASDILGERVRDSVVSAMKKIFETGVSNVDDEPEENSEHPARSGGIYNAIRKKESSVDKVLITVPETGWENDTENSFYHEVSVAEVNERTKLDIIPTSELMITLRSNGIAAIWIENDDGYIYVCTMGLQPTIPLSFYCEINEGVRVNG